MPFMRVVVVGHDLEAQQAFASVLAPSGVAPILATSAREAEMIVNRHFISLLFFLDEALGGGTIDSQWCAQPAVRQVPLVVVSRFDDWKHRLAALRSGASDYVRYPLVRDEIERVLELWSR